MPAVVKDHFARRIGLFTGLTMTLMALFGALAAGAAVPLCTAAGWQFALAVWAVPAALAAAVWGLLAAPGAAGAVGTRRGTTPPEEPGSAGGSLLRCALAWWVSAFLGLVSLMFYVLVAWLPQIMYANGYTPGQAGLMMSVMLTIGIPLGFVVPVVAARMRNQRLLVVAVVVAKPVSLAGLLLAPAYGWVWVCLLGAATGSAFPLAITLLGLRTDGARSAADLSGMAQTVGYLLAYRPAGHRGAPRRHPRLAGARGRPDRPGGAGGDRGPARRPPRPGTLQRSSRRGTPRCWACSCRRLITK